MQILEYDAGKLAAADPVPGFEPITSHSPFGCENGPIFERVSPGGRRIRAFRVAPYHINASGSCHGGMLMTFADILLATALFTLYGRPLVTVRLTTDFCGRAMLGDWVEGYAEALSMEGSLATGQGVIYVGDETVASFQGCFKMLGPSQKG